MSVRSAGRIRQKPNRVPIIVIEPNADHWLIIRAALAQCFPEVVPKWLNHTNQAQAYLDTFSEQETERPKFILLELYQPDRQAGLSLLASLKNNPLFQAIPTIVLSASSNVEDVRAAYQFSVASYMVKPATSEEWLNYVHNFRRYWWELVCLPCSR
ncbi:MAG: response regulator [Pedobacter sp.]|nr:MAG: response regulator [Pedobacter sp.]